jgi:alkylhydroperoxidase/carboxymuconolactone decarboxylase family protein YurZ
MVAVDEALENALATGATPMQIQEILSLVAGLGVHSLMMTSVRLVEAAKRAGTDVEVQFDDQRQALWDKYVGDDHYWDRFDRFSPGFLKAMLHLSPAQFEAFFAFCAVPWRGKTVSTATKELVAIACDASPSHRFLPGFLHHLEMAVAMGIGRRAIIETLDIAAAAPVHRGTR